MESRTGIFLILALCCAAGMLIAGCTQPAAPAQTPAATTAPPASGQPGTGIANPASVNCEKLGGTLEIKTDAAGGQYGMCNFRNGTSCEEWALFRGEGCKSGVQPSVSATAIGMANPAAVNCEKTGGKVDIRKDAAGNEYGMCLFANGTSCEEWALYRGEGCKPGTT